MNSVLLSFWDTVRHWISVDWSPITFGLIVGFLGVFALMILLNFFKGNFDKGKPIKWGNLIFLIIILVLTAVICAARFM